VLLLVPIQYVGDLVSDSEVDRRSSSEPEAEVEEEARQRRQMVADGMEEANSMADCLVAVSVQNMVAKFFYFLQVSPFIHFIFPFLCPYD